MMTCLILFAMSAITLWLVSLWRILSSSSVQDNSSFLSNSKGVGNGRRKSNVLLVVAHPDDESIMLLRENEEINIEAWELVTCFPRLHITGFSLPIALQYKFKEGEEEIKDHSSNSP